MPRLRKSRSDWDLVIDSDSDRPIGLMLDPKKPIMVRHLPTNAGEQVGIQFREWTWQNGLAGAGYSIETPESHDAGGSDYGSFVWLRRKGVAQPAGALTEVTLPTLVAALTTGRFTDAFEWGSGQDLFFSTLSRYVVKVTSGTTIDSTPIDFGSGSISTGCAIFNGAGSAKGYVGDAAGGIQEYNGATWTEGAAGTERGLLATPYWTLGDQLATGGESGDAGVGNFRLLGTNAAGTGFYHVSGDPKVSANWSSLTLVGPGNFAIGRLIESNRVVWFGFPSGIYGVDEAGYSPNYTKWLELAFSPNNCKAVAYWADIIWAATEQGLIGFAPSGDRVDIPTFAQFGRGQSNSAQIFGRPRALAPAPDGLYVGYFDGTDSYIGCLLLEGGQFRWSMAEAVIEGEEVTFLRQTSPGGNPRLWIGTVDASGVMHLYWQSLPKSGDPELDGLTGGPFVPAPSWFIRLSRFNGGGPVSNTFRRYMLELDYVGAGTYPGNYVEFQVAADGGVSTLQGTATTSPRWTATPTEGYVDAVSAQVKLVVHNGETTPVVIRQVGVRYSPHPELTKVKTYPVLIGDGVSDKRGKRDGRDPSTVLQRLERKQRAGPRQIIDEFGRQIEAIIESGLEEAIIPATDGNSYQVSVSLTISTSRSPARFDQGHSFDTGESFS